MQKLYLVQSDNKLISQHLTIASNSFQRMKGLLGTHELKDDHMLWIKMCNSIHTFFMNYPIDCIFLDDKLVIRGLKENIVPWRATWPVIAANSVIEMRAGSIKKFDLKEGDKFYVGA